VFTNLKIFEYERINKRGYRELSQIVIYDIKTTETFIRVEMKLKKRTVKFHHHSQKVTLLLTGKQQLNHQLFWKNRNLAD
jgi:hypothetical protein